MDTTRAVRACPTSVRAYVPTILNELCLIQRLGLEIKFVFSEVSRSWPDVKRDPITFVRPYLSKIVRRAVGVQL